MYQTEPGGWEAESPPLTFRKSTVTCQLKADRDNKQTARSKEEIYTAEELEGFLEEVARVFA